MDNDFVIIVVMLIISHDLIFLVMLFCFLVGGLQYSSLIVIETRLLQVSLDYDLQVIGCLDKWLVLMNFLTEESLRVEEYLLRGSGHCFCDTSQTTTLQHICRLLLASEARLCCVLMKKWM